MARSMLSDANLPKHFWGEAVQTATYLINRLPTKANNKNVPHYEIWNNKKPDLSNITTFGCKTSEEKAIEGILLGYGNRSKGYRIYTGNNKLMISRTVKFNENGMDNVNEKQNDKKNPNRKYRNLPKH